jgi:CheY-like chemotaxis protein
MIKNVLLVDDDYEMLLALKEGFGKYLDSFAVLLASDGLEAVEQLKKHCVSLVVTDLKMPKMDGFQLLTHIMEVYPDIPVIIITGYSTPEMERHARQGGAVGYIAKPFLIENLARQIMATLRKESEGGTLHNVSSGMFLQLVEMEQKTCTIRLEEKSTGRRGILFFREGELFDARVNDFQGETAAYDIFAWDQVNLSIQNGCAVGENKINRELSTLILEAMRRKDESAVRPEPAKPAAAPKPETPPNEAERVGGIFKIKQRIEENIGPGCGLEDIYQEDGWDHQIARLSQAGDLLKLGNMKLGYVDCGEARDYILLPGKNTTVVALDPKCPRDKLLKLLSTHRSGREPG